ncbi:fasciclin domain-containing protein [Polaribacter sp.]|uniref:fasciclin domain-containing protein n=1 Tax=Polaribacter sp. TaxID=1920175 RepID=UPI003F6BED4D
MINFIKKLFPILLLSLFIYSCDDDDPVVPETNTIVDVAINSNLSSLVTAVTRADLVTTLAEGGDFTVLAPTNEAFNIFLEANNFESVNDVPVPLLRNILLNHVISGRFQSTELSTSYAKTNAISDASGTNMSIYINVEDGVSFNGVSNVTTANVLADNGVVHVVDSVIGLPTVVTFATADPNFDSLEAALTRESDFTYVATLSTNASTSPAPFTVFAPTNEAFTSLINDDLPNSVSSLGDIDTETLRSTLNTHVVPGLNVLESSLSDDMPVSTLGGDLTVNITSAGATLTDSNDRISTITATDIQANNGVIHVINKVLLE